MTQALSWLGIVQGNGKLPDAMRREIANVIYRLGGKKVTVTVKETPKARSNNQNSYYWGICIPICTQIMRDAGNAVSEEDVHAFLKEHVGGLVTLFITPKGQRKAVVRSSASLGTKEFEEYLEKVRMWALEENVIIPLPNEHLIGVGNVA
jgi:hypothetical protein